MAHHDEERAHELVELDLEDRPDGPAAAAALAAGFGIFVFVRRQRGTALTARVRPGVADIVPSKEGEYRRILVPV